MNVILNSSLDGLTEAIERLRRELPGWWFSVCECQVSCDASIGIMGDSPDSDLIDRRDEEDRFDSGFHCDLSQPATLAEALNATIDEAIETRAKFRKAAA